MPAHLRVHLRNHNQDATMCRRKITVCIECMIDTMQLVPCAKWDRKTDRNIFGSGWMKAHVSENRDNLVNSVKVTVCSGCRKVVNTSDRTELEKVYKKKVTTMLGDMERRVTGVLNLRVGFPGFVIFV